MTAEAKTIKLHAEVALELGFEFDDEFPEAAEPMARAAFVLLGKLQRARKKAMSTMDPAELLAAHVVAAQYEVIGACLASMLYPDTGVEAIADRVSDVSLEWMFPGGAR